MKLIIKTILFWVLITSTAVFAELAKVKVNGLDIEYEMAGSGKHTILLEAGGSAGLSDWEPIYNSLTKYAKVIRYSRIGMPLSFRPFTTSTALRIGSAWSATFAFCRGINAA